MVRPALLIPLVLVLALGCARTTRNLDAKPHGTISGRLTLSGGPSSLNRRVVIATNTKTGHDYRTRTNDVGDYTFLVPSGRYRLDVTLGPSETLADPNPVIELHDDDIKADVNIAIVVHPA